MTITFDTYHPGHYLEVRASKSELKALVNRITDRYGFCEWDKESRCFVVDLDSCTVTGEAEKMEIEIVRPTN